MYEQFKWMLEEAECIGKVITANLYDDTFASIEVETKEGKRIDIKMCLKEN